MFSLENIKYALVLFFQSGYTALEHRNCLIPPYDKTHPKRELKKVMNSTFQNSLDFITISISDKKYCIKITTIVTVITEKVK